MLSKIGPLGKVVRLYWFDIKNDEKKERLLKDVTMWRDFFIIVKCDL